MSRRYDTQMMGDRYRFPTTSWHLVQAVRNVEALDHLIRIYWKPLYFFVRRSGRDNEESKDIVQGFLTELMRRDAFSKADPARGHFRTFLLASLTNFLKDRSKSEMRQKRGGDQAIFSLDFDKGESAYELEGARGGSPEALLHRGWAHSLLETSIDALEGDPSHLEAFRLYLKSADYLTICEKTGLSECAAKTAVHRMKRRLRDILLTHIRRTVRSEEDVETEVSDFISLLSQP